MEVPLYDADRVYGRHHHPCGDGGSVVRSIARKRASTYATVGDALSALSAHLEHRFKQAGILIPARWQDIRSMYAEQLQKLKHTCASGDELQQLARLDRVVYTAFLAAQVY